MAMLRHRDRQKAHIPGSVLYSSRTLEDVIYRNELDEMARCDSNLRVIYKLTRKQPEEWSGPRRRIDKALLAEVCYPPDQNPKIFVCGPTSLVEEVARMLVELGHEPQTIKTERFGPSGA
jgi:ferredoxin-NADP reductase